MILFGKFEFNVFHNHVSFISVVQFLTTIILDAKFEKIGNNQDFFPFISETFLIIFYV